MLDCKDEGGFHQFISQEIKVSILAEILSFFSRYFVSIVSISLQSSLLAIFLHILRKL